MAVDVEEVAVEDAMAAGRRGMFLRGVWRIHSYFSYDNPAQFLTATFDSVEIECFVSLSAIGRRSVVVGSDNWIKIRIAYKSHSKLNPFS